MEAHGPHWSEEELPLSDFQRQEYVAQSAQEQSQNLSFSEIALAAKGLEKQPDVIADLASKAAEADKPIEKLLEMRNEVKDEPASSQPVSVGSILAGLPRPTTAPVPQNLQSPMTVRQIPVAKVNKTREPIQSNNSLYRQAIKAGLTAALIIILIFLTSLLLT